MFLKLVLVTSLLFALVQAVPIDLNDQILDACEKPEVQPDGEFANHPFAQYCEELRARQPQSVDAIVESPSQFPSTSADTDADYSTPGLNSFPSKFHQLSSRGKFTKKNVEVDTADTDDDVPKTPRVVRLTADYVNVGAGPAGTRSTRNTLLRSDSPDVIFVSSGGSPAGRADIGSWLYFWGDGPTNSFPEPAIWRNSIDKIPSKFPDSNIHGGGGALNPGVATKFPKTWYDQMAAAGWSSFSFENMLPLIMGNENYTSELPGGDSAAHSPYVGHNGTTCVRTPQAEAQTRGIEVAGSVVTGVPLLDNQWNFTVGAGPGARLADIDSHGQFIRQNPYTKNIEPLLNQAEFASRLTFLSYTRCGPIKFKNGTGEAKSIRCIDEGNAILYILTFRKTLGLYAELSTNMILELSGVGDCNKLTSPPFNLSCVHHNPYLGETLHTDYSLPPSVYLATANYPAAHNPGHVSLVYFQSSAQAASGSNQPDLQVGAAYFAPATYLFLNYINIVDSNSSVHLSSPDITDDPRVQYRFGSHPNDAERACDLFFANRQIAGNASLYGGPTLVELSPGFTTVPNNDRVACKAWALKGVTSQYHHHGYCPMGLVTNEYGYVNGLCNVMCGGTSILTGLGKLPVHGSHHQSDVMGAKNAHDLQFHPQRGCRAPIL